jgi:hypothetical protein
MSRYDTYPFIKTARRGSSYCTRGGGFWIIRSGSRWSLVRMARPTEGIARECLGRFGTLTEAVAYYNAGVA